MKKLRFWAFTLLSLSLLCLPIRVATAQLKATLEGHTDNVWSVAFSPDGKTLASGSWDQTVRLWNVETEQPLHTLTGHTDTVMSVTFSPDGQTLVSGSWDGTIRLWNPHTGKLKRTLTDHKGGVGSVVFSPDGKMLASGSADQTVRLWNTTTWQVERTLTGHVLVVDSVAFSPEGAILASGSRDKTIRLWNPHTGQHIRTLTGHTNDVLRMMFSPDGAILASGGLDRTIRLWNPHTGKNTRTLPDQTGWVNPVAFSRDGGTLVIGGHGISLWDTDTQEHKRPLIEDAGTVVSVVFSPDGQMVASGNSDSSVHLWQFTPSNFESPTFNPDRTVKLIYFVPNDRATRPDRISALRELIKDTQQFFADQMYQHGFGRQTFMVETSANGDPIVHHIQGKFGEDYYNKNDKRNPDETIWEEIIEHFDEIQHIFFVAIDVSSERLGRDGGACGLGGITFFATNRSYGYVPFNFSGGFALRHRDITRGEQGLGGLAIIPASGDCFRDYRGYLHELRVTTHELGHAFGLDHDVREGNRENAVVGGRGFELSQCASEWLSVSRFFNPDPVLHDQLGKIEMLQYGIIGADTIIFRFRVTDPDGLHQAQLLVPEVYDNIGQGAYRLFNCIKLNGETATVQSSVRKAELADRITLQFIDVNGNITWATLSIQLDEVTPAQNLLFVDVNRDGSVNVLDLIVIASELGNQGQNLTADVNSDGTVNILDLILVAGMFDGAAAAPSAQPQIPETLTAVEVQGWLTDARALEVRDPIMKRGIVVLEQLLVSLTPKKTELLANYPNPFNPETWIPYRLAEDAFVTLTIYDLNGQIIRTLDVGHRIASAYESQSKAVHWDGRNNVGEQVASGVYFYTLTAGDLSATRKMLILK